MKLSIFILSALLTLSSLAEAKTVVVLGERARSIMEALASAGIPVNNIDEEWSGRTLSIQTGKLSCRYSVVDAPDEWMNGVQCYVPGETSEVLPNSLAIAKAISPFAAFEAAAGSRYLTANSINCALDYSARNYQCEVDAAEYGQ